MKKIYTILLLICFSAGLKAQVCNPDPIVTMLGVPGVFPTAQTGGMVNGTINQPYAQTFTVIVPADTTIDLSQFGLPLGTITVAINSMDVTAVDGLPAGLSYACDNGGCSWSTSTDGCFKVSGTPTQSGTFPVDVQVSINIEIPTFGPFSTPPIPNSMDLLIDGPGSVGNLQDAGFELGQNAPNPFNGTTLIPFTTSNPGSYNFIVVDINGRTVHAREVNATYGANVVEFNAANLASGIYHFRFEQNGSIATGKMMITE